MSRTYESNGPDVKIRGTAAHIADKYATLARDAISTGDIVMAENYLQHAEHYGRIIAAAMAAQNSRNEEGANANLGRGPQPDPNGGRDQDDDADETNAEFFGGNGHASRADQQPGDEDEEQERPVRAEAAEQRPRRESRGRRPRRDDTAEKAGNGNGGNGVHEAEGANGGEKPRRDISSDASMLPESILGSSGVAPEAGAED